MNYSIKDITREPLYNFLVKYGMDSSLRTTHMSIDTDIRTNIYHISWERFRCNFAEKN